MKTIFCVSFDTTGTESKKKENVCSCFCVSLVLSDLGPPSLSLCLSPSHHVSLSLFVSVPLLCSCVSSEGFVFMFSSFSLCFVRLVLSPSRFQVSVSSLLLSHTSGFILIVLVLSNLSHVLPVFPSSLFPV